MDIFLKNKDDSTLVVEASGRLDLDNAMEYEKAIMEEIDSNAEVKNILLDFSEITFIASYGLRVILECCKKMNARGGSLKIKGVSEDIRKSFNLVGFSKFIVLE